MGRQLQQVPEVLRARYFLRAPVIRRFRLRRLARYFLLVLAARLALLARRLPAFPAGLARPAIRRGPVVLAAPAGRVHHCRGW